jgi:hypothetical protein
VKRLLVLGTIGISSLLTIDAGAAVTIINAPPSMLNTAPARRTVTEAASREKWVGTRAILRDESTGKLRKPTAAETEQLVKTIKQLTARPSVRTTSTRGGAVEAAPAQVVIARATEDGVMETLCVQSFEEAATFLGLVQQPNGSNEQ